MREIAASVASRPGCEQSLVLKPDDSSGELVRIAVYSDEQSATQAANDSHVMALRSELHLAIEPGHAERSFRSL